MIEAHKLTHSIGLTRRQATQDRYGGVDEAWLPFAAARAQRVNTSASDFLRAGGEGSEIISIFRIRFRDDLTLDDRVTMGTRVYDILEIIEIGRRNGLEIRVRART